MPGHVRPRWRIAISIVHRCLKKRRERESVQLSTNRPKG
jgi:hypothetical protein